MPAVTGEGPLKRVQLIAHVHYQTINVVLSSGDLRDQDLLSRVNGIDEVAD